MTAVSLSRTIHGEMCDDRGAAIETAMLIQHDLGGLPEIFGTSKPSLQENSLGSVDVVVLRNRFGGIDTNGAAGIFFMTRQRDQNWPRLGFASRPLRALGQAYREFVTGRLCTRAHSPNAAGIRT